ncbi:MAG: PadR family transcriptional regulator [Candidatus Bipolaricaulota bacterium]|nr:PadR family transcriptional regulator [Candidatus Bipolaricaulota bacterium]
MRMEELVLGLLKLGPAHGYELRSRVRAELGPAWRVASSQLYAWLRRLEEGGFVRASTLPAPGRPPRVVYTLTPAGEGRFWKWLLAPLPRDRRRRGAHLVRLYFLARFAPERIPEFVDAQRAVLERRGRELRTGRLPRDPFGEAVRRLRLAQVEAGLRWLDEVEQLFAVKEGR